jgi:molecular chaperone GrpE (heat shock protein)
MKLQTVQQALGSLPQVNEPASAASEPIDVLGAVAEFSKLLRKVGVQQTREVREILSSLQSSGSQTEEIRQAWQREQERAAASEQQLRKLAEVLIAALDILERMHAAFEAAPGMQEWAQQTRQAIDVALHNSKKIGLVPLGAPGEPFDVAIHDLESEVPPGHRDPVHVGSVTTRGYALNGKVLRRASVDYMS